MPEPAGGARSAWGPGSRLLTAGLVFMVTVTAFEGLAVPTVLPATFQEFGGLPLYGWAFAGFFLAQLVGIAVAGLEADRRGATQPLLVGAFLFAAGLVVSGLAPGMEWVVVGRVIQGLGAGAIYSIVYVIIGRGYDTAAQPLMIAIISSAWVIPGLVGPALAGYVAQEASWRWTFLALVPWLPLSALFLVRPLSRLPGTRPEAEPPGSGAIVADALRLAAGAGLALAALTIGIPWLAVLMLIAGPAIALRPLRRLLPVGALTASPGRGAAVAALALLSVTFLGAEAFVPLAVTSVRSAGTVVGGLALSAAAVTWATGAWLQARFAARGSRTWLLVVGAILIGVGIAIEAAIPVSALPVWVAAAAWAVAGLGMGLAYSTATLVVIETAEPGAEGAAATGAQLANTLGVAIGTGVAGAVVAFGATRLGGLAPAITLAQLLLVVVCGLTVLISRRVPDRVIGTAEAAEGMPAEGETA
ncbi:MAG TPA: MFS transporter [Candidatus Limnocylindria bacterium]